MAAPTHASAFSDGAAYERTLGPAHAYYLRVKADQLVRLVERHQPATRRLVDLGCGTGELEQLLGDRRWELVGVDASESMIQHATAKALPGAEFVTADASATGLPGASFDVAFATSLYHHVPPKHRRAVMEEMVRLTKPGGLVVVFEHNALNPITRRMVRSCPVDEDAILLRRGEVEFLARERGLRIVERRYLVFFPRPLRFLRRVEEILGWCPLGGQYVVAAARPTGSDDAR